MNEELLARFREEVSHGRMWGSVDSFEKFLTTHTLSKKEVARVIEGLKLPVREPHEGEYVSEWSQKEATALATNQTLTDLSKALGLGEGSV